jgi:hypothetical protein
MVAWEAHLNVCGGRGQKLYYSVGPLFEVVSSVSDPDILSMALASGPLDCATTCVGVNDVMYSNFRESSVNVTGPCRPRQQNQDGAREQCVRIDVTSLVRLTFIMAPNLPSVS